ncbi:hypothetical protein ACFXPS_03725 [Nocardia sp. NPDC059091]|uniref:hypothetical protein n=1 Tax=Nocardia sp. NPDC059091 TaxID=3346724 RepID=UPI003680E66F
MVDDSIADDDHCIPLTTAGIGQGGQEFREGPEGRDLVPASAHRPRGGRGRDVDRPECLVQRPPMTGQGAATLSKCRAVVLIEIDTRRTDLTQQAQAQLGVDDDPVGHRQFVGDPANRSRERILRLHALQVRAPAYRCELQQNPGVDLTALDAADVQTLVLSDTHEGSADSIRGVVGHRNGGCEPWFVVVSHHLLQRYRRNRFSYQRIRQ